MAILLRILATEKDFVIGNKNYSISVGDEEFEKLLTVSSLLKPKGNITLPVEHTFEYSCPNCQQDM